GSPGFPVHTWTKAQRLAAAALQALLLAAVLAASAVVVLFTFDGRPNPAPPPLAGVLGLVALGLAALLGLLRWRSAATLQVESGRLLLEGRGDRFEIPRDAVTHVRSWRLPLPGPGLTFGMRSGRDFQYGLQVGDPLAVLEALGREPAQAHERILHPCVAFSHARATVLRPGWPRRALAYLLFPLVTGGIMFRANQYISYGGPFAQYRMYGLGPYLLSFFTYWMYFTASLVLFAAFLRVLAEVLAVGGTWLSSRHAKGMRRFVEGSHVLLYFVVPLLFMALQFGVL
ncbi:MAG: hypothetical protein ABW123_16900, partial [Cystobacter sp.]